MKQSRMGVGGKADWPGALHPLQMIARGPPLQPKDPTGQQWPSSAPPGHRPLSQALLKALPGCHAEEYFF